MARGSLPPGLFRQLAPKALIGVYPERFSGLVENPPCFRDFCARRFKGGTFWRERLVRRAQETIPAYGRIFIIARAEMHRQIPEL